MGSIVGFSLYQAIDTADIGRAKSAQQRALSYYKHLESKSIEIGRTRLEIWGHPEISECVHRMADGDLLVRVGSPHNQVAWRVVEEGLQKAGRSECYVLPWEGRVVLLRISPDGERWMMWNDWIGSIPVYHAGVGSGRIASTLEPVVVAGGGYTPDDFFLPGLVSLLINGHFLSDWTLYKDMKVVPPDSAAQWDENGFRWQQLWTVEPSQDRWESSWDDLVDEMYELSHKAIADVLKTQPQWILPLSSGLDSRLIAAVGADIGANILAYVWGSEETTDVVYSRQIAKTLGIPWKHIELPRDFLVKYTPQWAALFGSSKHFHGMYLMSFLNELDAEPLGRIVSGFLGDTVATDSLALFDPDQGRIYRDWSPHWHLQETRELFRINIDGAISHIASILKAQLNSFPGAKYQKFGLLEIWSRQSFMNYFQLVLPGYKRGVAAPFIDRMYARFCMSLPRAVLADRLLQKAVYRRYYGKLAIIPGSYASEPIILTGSYLLNRRITRLLPIQLHLGVFKGFNDAQLRMDTDSIRESGRAALWPIDEVKDSLSEWIDFTQIDQAYQSVLSNREDIRPLRKLQSIQTFAYRLLDT